MARFSMHRWRSRLRRYGGRAAAVGLLVSVGAAIAFFDTSLAERSRFPANTIWSALPPSLRERDFLQRNYLAAATRRVQGGTVVLGVGEPREADNGQTVYPRVGTGVIFDPRGHGITAASLVADRDRPVAALLSDGRKVPVTVRGVDRVLGTAAIALELGGRDDAPVSPLNLERAPRPGDWTIAIGSPAGLTRTVAIGTVSATDRGLASTGIDDRQAEFIQTDMAVSQGLDGGPLAAADGAVIGVLVRRRVGSDFLSYGVPIAAALRSAQQMLASGTVRHRYLGLVLVPLSPERRDAFNQTLPSTAPNTPPLTLSQGLAIAAVDPDGPAAGKMQVGDVITTVNGRPMGDVSSYRHALETPPDAHAGRPGDRDINAATVVLRRGDRTTQVTLTSAPSSTQLPPP